MSEEEDHHSMETFRRRSLVRGFAESLACKVDIISCYGKGEKDTKTAQKFAAYKQAVAKDVLDQAEALADEYQRRMYPKKKD